MATMTYDRLVADLVSDTRDPFAPSEFPIDSMEAFESMMVSMGTEVASTGTTETFCEVTTSTCSTNCGCGTTVCVTVDPCIGDSVSFCGC